MGLFSSKKIVSVDTSVSRVIEDKLLPDSPKQGVIAALFSNDDQMTEHILEKVTNSVGVKAERMYDYAKRSYMYGLPSNSLLLNSPGESEVRGVLAEIAGYNVDIEYCHFGPLNNLHYGWTVLVNTYGYDAADNTLGTLSASYGVPVFLQDMQVVVVEASTAELQNGSLAQWGVPPNAGRTPLRESYATLAEAGVVPKPTPFGVDGTVTEDYFRVTHIRQVRRRSFPTGLITFPMSTEDPNLDYFQVKYSYQEDGKATRTTRFWTYRHGAGDHPTLDALFTPQHDPLGSFFPLAYVRYNKTPTSSDPTSQEYKQTKKLLKYLDMDYDTVRDAINQNPDIENVESALIMMGVPANTSNSLEQRYLFDFFRRLHLQTGGMNLSASNGLGALQAMLLRDEIPQLSVVIQDARFKMALRMSGLYRRKKAGNVGPKGSYSSAQGSQDIVLSGVRVDRSDDGATPYTWTVNVPCYYYRHQITDTVYEEVSVYGLSIVWYVSGNYADQAFEGEPTLLIPLDHSITEDYSASEREMLYARSLHYVFNTKIVTKVKWYQSSFFKFVMIVVAVVISILTFNPGPLMAALAAGGMVLATFIATAILEALLFSLAFKLFVKLVGAKFAMLIAVVAAVYSLGSGMMNEGSLKGVPWGEELLQISSGLSKAVTDSIQGDMQELQKEMGEFQSFMEEQNTALEKANSLLEHQTLLSPFLVFGESPTDYYERTVHSGNIGVLGLDAVTNYCDVALTLPKLSQTLGESVNPEAFAFNNMG